MPVETNHIDWDEYQESRWFLVSNSSFRGTSMLPIRLAKLAVSKAAKPTAYTALAAAVLWIGVDLLDGASDRFHQRVDQVSTTVREPVEDTSNKLIDKLSRLIDNLEDNPGPVILTLVMFGVAFYFHKKRGHSTVEALKATLLRESTAKADEENPVITRVKKQTIMNEMSAMHEQLLARNEVLPNLIVAARKELEDATLKATRAAKAAEETATVLRKTKAHYDNLVKEEKDNDLAINEIQVEFDRLST
jgi:outer membrane murein-binding lipoprotein Lpp